MPKNTKAASGKTAKKAPWSTKLMFKALPDDIVIPVMGPTGVGKSTFINCLARDSVKVGHGLDSCTAELQPVVITSSQHPKLGGQRLVIVDTPGFDDTKVPDSEILHCIASWLATVYDSEMKLGGVIYLHNISLSRMPGTTLKNLEMFQKLCGDDAFRSVILGTTGWGETIKDDGDMRTQELRDVYWKDMLDHGSKIFEFEESSKSAWTMVDSIVELNRSRGEVLQIQRELVDAHKLIPDTEAGQKLRNDLDQVLKKLKEDRKAQKKDESARLELDHKIAQVREQMKLMQVPVSQRVLGFLSLGVDKILDAVALYPLAPEPPITRLAIDCDRLVLLFGENREVKNMLLKLLSAQEVDVGNDQNAPTQEIKCWSVGTNEETSIIIDTPDFDSSSNPGRVFQRTRNWLETSCREDMKLGVLYLKLSGLDPSSSPESPPTRSHIDGSPSISPPEKDVHPSSIMRRSNDTSLPAAPREGPPTTIVWGDEGITSATTAVVRDSVATKQPVSPGLLPRFLRSKGPQHALSPAPLPAGIAGSSLSAMELFQGLPSSDTILFATLTTKPKSKEVREAGDMPYHTSDGKVVEFENTPEAAQAMLHLSLEKTLSVSMLLDTFNSPDGETTSKGGKFKRKLGRLGSLLL